MTATIKLLVNSGSGVLAAVVSTLQAAGMRVKSHSVEPVNSSSSMMTLQADGAGTLDETELESKLSGIPVVQSVEEISTGNRVSATRTPRVSVPGELVKRVVASFPEVMPHLQDYEEQIAKDSQRVEKLNQLGVESGQNFAADLEHGYLESISDVIDEVVLPSIVSIAEASRSGNTIVVPISLFTRRVATSMELFSGDDENCDFLCGFIEGLSSSVPGHESVSVIETRCRVDGDPACVFSLV